jgi:hypothetical protein
MLVDFLFLISYGTNTVGVMSTAASASYAGPVSDILSLFQRLLPASFLQRLQSAGGIRRNNRVYTPLVVLWLLVVQRLHGGVSMETAVLELLRGLPATFWPRPCKRILDLRRHGAPLSGYSGAYNQARQALPLTVVEQSCDAIFEQLTAQLPGTVPVAGARVFFFDGTSVRLAHSPTLCINYPPGSNQHGEAHWPVLRMLVAHDLHTGLGMRPEWGPMFGDRAVSEQGLLELAIGRLPPGSIVAGDANFGVSSVAWAAVQRGHPVLLRLSLPRAQRLAGGLAEDGIDRPVVWRPSRADRKCHPELPADASLAGRLIVRQVQPDNGSKPFLLALFTTLQAGQAEVLNLYGLRWNIETDLRTLKCTLQLEQLSCTTPEMVAKEINIALATYNLVRAITCLASERSGIPPRGYSFTKVRRIIETFTPLVANAASKKEGQKHFDRMMYYVHQAKLPKRKRKRPAYPRVVWGRGEKFPNRKAGAP